LSSEEAELGNADKADERVGVDGVSQIRCYLRRLVEAATSGNCFGQQLQQLHQHLCGQCSTRISERLAVSKSRRTRLLRADLDLQMLRLARLLKRQADQARRCLQQQMQLAGIVQFVVGRQVRRDPLQRGE
jgi:hypothetical protein